MFDFFMYFHVVIKCPDFAHIIVFTNQMLFVHEFLSHLILFFHCEAEVLTLIVTLMIIFIGSSIAFCFDIILIRILYTLQPICLRFDTFYMIIMCSLKLVRVDIFGEEQLKFLKTLFQHCGGLNYKILVNFDVCVA